MMHSALWRFLTQSHCIRRSLCCNKLIWRNFSPVKEVSWASKSGSSPKSSSLPKFKNAAPQFGEPIERFGVIAAMSKNRVIGVNGDLPWDLPLDRQHFVQITRDATIIIGRKTFLERPNQSHIAHVRRCIVVSKTLDCIQQPLINNGPELLLARSFPEALHLAREDQDESTTPAANHENDTSIRCWVAGGEQLYDLALTHANSTVLDLTVVNTEIEISQRSVSRFPAAYRWENRFQQVSLEDVLDGGFTRYRYRRIRK